MSDASIESVSRETRVFSPPETFTAKAWVREIADYRAMYERSLSDPEAFWREQAAQLHWFAPPQTVLTWQPPHARWFDGGTTNISFNCLDRHLVGSHRDKPALIWEGEPGDVRVLTYHQLHEETCRLANALRNLGVDKGDRVGIYMGMVPEAAIAMLACTRIGAIHNVVFGGFAAEAVSERMNDASAKVLLTQDGAWRRGSVVPLKLNVDRALATCPSVKHVVVLRRIGEPVAMTSGRDIDWRQLVSTCDAHCEAVALPSEHPSFILYTSGTTGRPKGVLHTTAGYLLCTYLTSKLVFDLHDDDVYFCTADIGWITGHSYVVYGPLANAATVLIYEGAPNHPDPARLWDIIERHRATILYTAPTAIRAFIRWGEQFPARHDLSSLRLLGSVGEPINPEAWMWYRRVIGRDRCPIVDTWWQTETGAIMITPLPGSTATKPGSCTLPFFGVSPKVLREDGSEAAPNEGGLLVLDKPWPSMLRTIWGDDERFREQYFTRFPGQYFTGDSARKDEDGYYWVMGRVDDVVNVAGHRLGTAEVESALVAHPAVAEAAVVGRPDQQKGQALVAFVTLKHDHHPSQDLRTSLIEHVANEIGRFAKPDTIRFADALPKTRSGKIMRRLLKSLASGQQPTGDVTTLEDISVLASLREHQEE